MVTLFRDMPLCRLRSVSVLLMLVCTLLPGLPLQAAAPFDGDVTLTLENGVPIPAAPLTLALTMDGKRWEPDVYGVTPTCSRTLHTGEIVRGTMRTDALHVVVAMTINGDKGFYGQPALPEGVAEYTIDVTQRDGALAGAFTGSFTPTVRGVVRPDAATTQLSGKVTGTVGDPWPPKVTGQVPVQPGEHPRLFFRKGELPLLRRRANTPQGQQMIAKLRDLLKLDKGGTGWGTGVYVTKAPPYTDGQFATGHAFLYALTGDRDEADRAKLITQLAMARNGGEWGAWGNGLRIAGVATAYDLCYDVWDAEFRGKVAEWLCEAANGRGRSMDDHMTAMFAAGGGLAALAILNDPAPAPDRPQAPAQATFIPVPQGFVPGNGVPVSPFAEGLIAPEWLVAGEFEKRGNDDPLAAVGGCAAARIALGTRISYGDTNVAFSARKTGPAIGLYKFDAGVQLADRVDKSLPTYAYFHAVLDNDAPRCVRAYANPRWTQYGVTMPTFGGRLWIGGREVRDGEVIRLEAGKYPVTYELALYGQMTAAPRLLTYGEKEYQAALTAWQQDLAAYRTAGETMPYADRRLRMMAQMVRGYLRLSMGDRGFSNEDSNETDTSHNLLPFAQAYRNVTGRDLASGTGLEWVVPLQMATHERFWHNDWCGNMYWTTLGFPDVVPAQYKPALKWTMDHQRDFGISLPSHAMFALLSYPWEVEAKDPKEMNLPLVWEDRKLGGFVFRSGWDDTKDFIATIVLRSNSPRSSLTAGDFTIGGGSGQSRWCGYFNAGGGFFRPACLDAVERPSVVRIEGTIPTRGAKLTYLQTKPDGSAVLSMVQDYWVKGSASDAHGSPTVEDPANLGISTLRSIAVDYSGASGAPALVVVADKVTGAAGREVREQLNFNGPTAGAIEGNAFTLLSNVKNPTRPPMTLQATVITPSDAQLAFGKKYGEPNMLTPKIGDAFLMVFTIQEGPAPEVKVEGSGLNAKITVGSQTITFDGEKVVLAK